ncbi:unnamed protein product, partial [Iphiclides podalirius]
MSEINGQNSFQDRSSKKFDNARQALNKSDKQSNANKIVEFTKFASSTWKATSTIMQDSDAKMDELEFIIKQIEHQQKPSESSTTNIRDDYEEIHRKIPGLFWDTISMDNPEFAFKKMKRIIQDIVNSQKHLEPMIDIDFINMSKYITAQNRLDKICRHLGSKTLFV